MDNKEIQEKRMRGYFIDATREMLKGEGLKSINVRAVADRAGYSYATLYNYFKDIKELIFICVQGFQEEAETFINSKTKKSKPGIERINEKTKAYIEYFTQYPGIFELFFLEKLNTLSGKQPTANLIFTFYDRITAEDWEYCITENIFTSDEVASRTKILKYSITGILLMYMNRMHPESYKEFLADINQLLEIGLKTN